MFLRRCQSPTRGPRHHIHHMARIRDFVQDSPDNSRMPAQPRTVIDPTAAGTLRAWFLTGGSLELRILSSSMWPTIRPAERVRVTPVGTRQLRRGEVVLVQLGGRPTVHRIRRVGDEITTQGDAARSPDPPLSKNDVLGRVVAVERHGQWRRLPSDRGANALARLATAAALGRSALRSPRG